MKDLFTLRMQYYINDNEVAKRAEFISKTSEHKDDISTWHKAEFDLVEHKIQFINEIKSLLTNDNPIFLKKPVYINTYEFHGNKYSLFVTMLNIEDGLIGCAFEVNGVDVTKDVKLSTGMNTIFLFEELTIDQLGAILYQIR